MLQFMIHPVWCIHPRSPHNNRWQGTSIAITHHRKPAPVAAQISTTFQTAYDITYIATSLHRYTCAPKYWRSCHNVALPLEFVCRCWAANECIVSALKVAAVVVCVWPGSAEAMSFFFQTCRCGELRVHGHLLSRLKAMLAFTLFCGWMIFSLCSTLMNMKASSWREFWKKSLDIIECSNIYTRNAFTSRCLMFTFASADAHGAHVLHVRI